MSDTRYDQELQALAEAVDKMQGTRRHMSEALFHLLVKKLVGEQEGKAIFPIGQYLVIVNDEELDEEDGKVYRQAELFQQRFSVVLESRDATSADIELLSEEKPEEESDSGLVVYEHTYDGGMGFTVEVTEPDTAIKLVLHLRGLSEFGDAYMIKYRAIPHSPKFGEWIPISLEFVREVGGEGFFQTTFEIPKGVWHFDIGHLHEHVTKVDVTMRR